MRDLKTDRLLLSCRSLTRAEIDSAYRMYVEEMEEHSLTLEAFEQEVQFDHHLAQNALGQDFGRPAIYLGDEKRRIGHCVLLPRLCNADELAAVGVLSGMIAQNSIEAEIGWAVSEKYRNQGYATEVGIRLIQYAFEELHLARVFAFTENDNPISLRVMQKIGMRVSQLGDTNQMIGLVRR